MKKDLMEIVKKQSGMSDEEWNFQMMRAEIIFLPARLTNDPFIAGALICTEQYQTLLKKVEEIEPLCKKKM
jgi:hypothetical protein